MIVFGLGRRHHKGGLFWVAIHRNDPTVLACESLSTKQPVRVYMVLLFGHNIKRDNMGVQLVRVYAYGLLVFMV